MNFPSKSLNFSFFAKKQPSQIVTERTISVLSSQNSINNSRFEEAKYVRKQRDNDVLQKINNNMNRSQQNKNKVIDCFKKFRPVQKKMKEN